MLFFTHKLISLYKKNNLNKNGPFNGLEHDISYLRTEDTIIFLGDFNVRISNKRAIILSNISNHDPLWLDSCS
jgi:hypothetical protein